MIDGVTLFWDR